MTETLATFIDALLCLNNAVKYSVLCLCGYALLVRSLPYRPGRKKRVAGFTLMLLLGISMSLLRSHLMHLHLMFLMTAYVFICCGVFGNNIRGAVALSIITFGCSCVAYAMGGFSSGFVYQWMDLTLFPERRYVLIPESAFSSLSSHDGRIATFLFVFCNIFAEIVHISVMSAVLKIKRLKKGLAAVCQSEGNSIPVVLSFLLVFGLTLLVLTGFLQDDNYNEAWRLISLVLIWLLLFCGGALVLWIKREFHTVYLNTLRHNELMLLETGIAEKDRLIAALREDNDRLAAVIHKDNKLIPSMVQSVRTCIAHLPETEETAADRKAISEAAQQLDSIYAQRAAAVTEYETHQCTLPPTGSISTDAVLTYMAQIADKKGVGFTLTVETDGEKPSAPAVERHECNILLADLIENALIAITDSDRKQMAVILRQSGEKSCITVKDSGTPFALEVLRQMGKRKITTHGQEGGSGIGLMTIFEILRHNDASLMIEEYASPSPFTKAVSVVFDKSNRRVIKSGRADTLRTALRHTHFTVEETDIPETTSAE